MRKALPKPAQHETVVHDYSGPDRMQLVPSKRTTDPQQRPQVIHFDLDIKCGDHLVLGYDPMQASTYRVAANIRHLKGTWWATLEPLDAPPVTVTGQTFSSRRLGRANPPGTHPALPSSGAASRPATDP